MIKVRLLAMLYIILAQQERTQSEYKEVFREYILIIVEMQKRFYKSINGVPKYGQLLIELSSGVII